MAIRHKYLNQYCGSIILSSSLALLGVMGGVIPEFSPSLGSFNFTYTALAQSDREVKEYAQLALRIERLRQRALADIRRALLGKEPPTIVCNQPESFNSLNQAAREIADDYCQKSKKIVEDSDLSVSTFNSMTARLQSDRKLMERVQNEMRRLQ